MAEEFELPDDIKVLNDADLADLLEGATQAFAEKSNANAVTSDDLAALRALATAVDDIRKEQASREEAALAAAAEIDALAARVRGTDDDRRQARAAAVYDPQQVIDHLAEHGEDDALDLYGAQLVATAVRLAASTAVRLGR